MSGALLPTMAMPLGGMIGVDPIGNWRSKLDPDAVRGLEAVGPQVAASICADLDARGASVRNPSAYVSKAIANAKTGTSPAGSAALPPFGTVGTFGATLAPAGTIAAEYQIALSKLT